jgi:hypothetical protein
VLWGVGKLVNLTALRFLNRWHKNQDFPFPLEPVISINRCLPSKLNTCCSFLKESNFHKIQAQNFQRATKRKQMKKTNPNQSLLDI